MIAQVPAKVTYSTSKESGLVLLDKGCEVDPWINNIFAEAPSLTNPAQTGMKSAPGLSTLTVVHDLKEDISRGNNILSNAVLKMFLENQRVVNRRNAICAELEMIKGFVKINGAKFSLWELRAELHNIKNRRYTDHARNEETALVSESQYSFLQKQKRELSRCSFFFFFSRIFLFGFEKEIFCNVAIAFVI